MKVIAIIPAFNEEATIKMVINEIRQYEDIDVIVINDGSKDRTSIIARETGTPVIDFNKNQGIGLAMKAGYQYAKERDYDIAIQVDADGQHDISKINELIFMIEEKEYDMVIGSRYIVKTGHVSSFIRYLGIKYFSALLYIFHKKSIKDTTSGYRAVNKHIINYFAEYYPPYYPEVPTLSNLMSQDKKICEIPVDMRRRQAGKSSISFFDSFHYLIKITYICIKERISYRKGEK